MRSVLIVCAPFPYNSKRWRIDEGIDSLSVEDVQSEIRKQKLLLHGFDNHGQPTIVVYPGRHIPKVHMALFVPLRSYAPSGI